jgi:FkbM family methyltransferase
MKFIQRFGYTLEKAPVHIKGVKVEYDFLKKHQWILNLDIQTILDIGANKGQFAARFRFLFPETWIFSFEPIPEIYEQLCKRFATDSKFKAFNLGIGKESGSIDFFQNEFTDSSSAFPMKGLHIESFPKTSVVKKIQIEIYSLDEVVKSISISFPLLIKIDVQGFEEMVILGGKDTLKKASIVIIEVSFYELYENQVFFSSIYDYMQDLGFSYHGNYEQLLSPLDGSILQADAIFLRENV